jgi:hypothetical protein
MERCVNLREGANGGFEDPVSLDEVQEADLVTFEFGQPPNGVRRFCYDALNLLRYIGHQLQGGGNRPLIVPERFELSPEQVQHLYETARARFPQNFIIAEGDHATPYVFRSLETATTFVSNRQRGAVYQVAQAQDATMAELLYPRGLEGLVPVFAVRAPFQRGDHLPAGRAPMWQRDEPAIRQVVYERAAPGSPVLPVRIPSAVPGAPGRRLEF